MKKFFASLLTPPVFLGLLLITGIAFADKPTGQRPYLVSVEKMRVVEAADLLGIAETTADVLIVVDRPAAIASGTCPMPANPIDGQVFMISTRSAITSLTLNASGRPVSGTITTLAAGAAAGWTYDQISNRWFRNP